MRPHLYGYSMVKVSVKRLQENDYTIERTDCCESFLTELYVF